MAGKELVERLGKTRRVLGQTSWSMVENDAMLETVTEAIAYITAQDSLIDHAQEARNSLGRLADWLEHRGHSGMAVQTRLTGDQLGSALLRSTAQSRAPAAECEAVTKTPAHELSAAQRVTTPSIRMTTKSAEASADVRNAALEEAASAIEAWRADEPEAIAGMAVRLKCAEIVRGMQTQPPAGEKCPRCHGRGEVYGLAELGEDAVRECPKCAKPAEAPLVEETGGPFHPVPDTRDADGKRDWLVGTVLAGMWANQEVVKRGTDWMVQHADIMAAAYLNRRLSARSKE